jgi:hypothetical protein
MGEGQDVKTLFYSYPTRSRTVDAWTDSMGVEPYIGRTDFFPRMTPCVMYRMCDFSSRTSELTRFKFDVRRFGYWAMLDAQRSTVGLIRFVDGVELLGNKLEVDLRWWHKVDHGRRKFKVQLVIHKWVKSRISHKFTLFFEVSVKDSDAQKCTLQFQRS